MIVSINQPAYLPWLGYFQRIERSDLHVVLDHVQFERHSYTNRNQILLNGQKHWLTVPVQTAGLGLEIPINEITIDNRANWRRKHLASVEHGYRRTSGLRACLDLLSGPLGADHQSLNELLAETTGALLSFLEISTPLITSSSMAIRSSKSQLVLDICKEVGADTYLSGPFGREYLDIGAFETAGLSVQFHDYEPVHYDQELTEFVRNLSAVDAICRLGEGAGETIRSKDQQRVESKVGHTLNDSQTRANS